MKARLNHTTAIVAFVAPSCPRLYARYRKLSMVILMKGITQKSWQKMVTEKYPRRTLRKEGSKEESGPTAQGRSRPPEPPPERERAIGMPLMPIGSQKVRNLVRG